VRRGLEAGKDTRVHVAPAVANRAVREQGHRHRHLHNVNKNLDQGRESLGRIGMPHLLHGNIAGGHDAVHARQRQVLEGGGVQAGRRATQTQVRADLHHRRRRKEKKREKGKKGK
jgi:hypothetical protein